MASSRAKKRRGSRWQRFWRWYWRSDDQYRACLIRIERLERELFPEWFPKPTPTERLELRSGVALPVVTSTSNYIQIQKSGHVDKRYLDALEEVKKRWLDSQAAFHGSS